MPNVITVDGPDAVRMVEREKLIRYKLTLSGAYVQAIRATNTGELIDLTKVVGVNKEDQFWGKNGPKRVYVVQAPAGYGVSILPGADGLHWLLKVWSAVGVELAAAAYPAAITADVDVYLEASGRTCD
jgi:hypothetical protein